MEVKLSVYVLEFSTIIPFTLRFPYKSCSSAAHAEHSPILLEYSEVGRVVTLSISYLSISTILADGGGCIP